MGDVRGRHLHVLSFDIEDWFHIVDIPGLDDPAKWDGLERDLGTLVERRTDDILAGFYVPDEGRADPVGCAVSMAKGARMLGADIPLEAELETLIPRLRPFLDDLAILGKTTRIG